MDAYPRLFVSKELSINVESETVGSCGSDLTER